MNRTVAKIALAASALALSGAAAAPAAMASSYPPVTPPQTTPEVPAAPSPSPTPVAATECTPVDGQDPNSTPPPGRETSPEVLASNLPWWCTPITQHTSAARTVDTLAYTGAEIGTAGALGLGLVVGGGLLVRSARKTPSDA